MIAAVCAMLRDERGATLAEYGMIAAGIAVPFICIALAILATASGTLGNTTTGLQALGANPP